MTPTRRNSPVKTAAPSESSSTDGIYHFDGRAADAAVRFFPTYLRLTAGEWAGKPFHLEPWEADEIVRPLFGWKRPDGTRRYRRCYVWVPRKNGKTELAAGIGLLMEVGDGELGAEVYSIAADKDQAKIVFNKATAMVQWSEKLSTLLNCLKTAIYCPETNASFKPLSGTPEGKHGLNMSGLIGDEIHEWLDDRLYTFVHQSSASRRQPLEFLISTAGEKRGYGWEIWEYCQKVLSGEIDDPETLVVVYAADPELNDKDPQAWTRPETWAQANPNFNVTVKQAYLEAECQKAQALPRLENDFKRYHLNLWTEQTVRWLPIAMWDASAGPVAWHDLPEAMLGRSCYVGTDLSSTKDLSCSVKLFEPDSDYPFWVLVPRFYLPAATLADRVKQDRAPYDRWLKVGALQVTEGNAIDHDFIEEDLRQDAEKYRFLGAGFDPFNAMQVMIHLQNDGMPVEQVRQGYLTLSGPSKELERLLLSNMPAPGVTPKLAIAHGGHPALRWCAGNVAVETDPAGNIKPSKAKSTERIDGIAATVTGLALAIKGGEVPMSSPYEDPNFSIRPKSEPVA